MARHSEDGNSPCFWLHAESRASHFWHSLVEHADLKHILLRECRAFFVTPGRVLHIALVLQTHLFQGGWSAFILNAHHQCVPSLVCLVKWRSEAVSG